MVILKQQPDEQTYQLYTEFKSHESEFDFLTSMEIEEKINMIEWFPFSLSNGAELLMTTNGAVHFFLILIIKKECKLTRFADKTIKLFRMSEKIISNGDRRKTDVVVKPRRVYEGAHAYNINGIAFNSDGETFLSSDDLRINLWHINIKNEAFGIVDMKPENMDELSEVITCAGFHPTHCNIMIYSSSKGIIRIGDLRDAALCERYAKCTVLLPLLPKS